LTILRGGTKGVRHGPEKKKFLLWKKGKKGQSREGSQGGRGPSGRRGVMGGMQGRGNKVEVRKGDGGGEWGCWKKKVLGRVVEYQGGGGSRVMGGLIGELGTLGGGGWFWKVGKKLRRQGGRRNNLCNQGEARGGALAQGGAKAGGRASHPRGGGLGSPAPEHKGKKGGK